MCRCAQYGCSSRACEVPERKLTAGSAQDQCQERVGGGGNATVDFRLFRGFPLPVLHASLEVLGGHEVLYNYADEYWQTAFKNEVVIKATKRAAVREQELAEAKQVRP